MQSVAISISQMENRHSEPYLNCTPPQAYVQTKVILKSGNCPFKCNASCASYMPKSFKNTTDRTRQLWTPPESNLESLNQEFASLNFSVYQKTRSATSPRTAKQAAG